MKSSETKDYNDRFQDISIHELISIVQEEGIEEKRFSANELINAYEEGLKKGHSNRNDNLKFLTISNIRSSFKVIVSIFKALNKLDEFNIRNFYFKIEGTDLFKVIYLNTEILKIEDKIFFYQFTDDLKQNMLAYSEFRINISLLEGVESFNRESLLDDGFIELL